MNASHLAENLDPAAATFSFTLREDGVGLIEINVPGDRQNTLKAEFGPQFDAVLELVRTSAGLKALVIASGKPGSFVAGADIHLFDALRSAEDVAALSRECQRGFAALQALPITVVAAINGACLGGGLELALACDARIAAAGGKTALGLPEVMLGLLPAGGGSQRLPRLIGIARALDLMLTGRQLRPGQALELGLVDAVVDADVLIEAAANKALALSTAPQRRTSLAARARALAANPQAELTDLALEANPLGRRLLFRQARKQALARSHGNYPAIEAILDVVETGMGQGEAAGYAAEAKAFGELAMSPQSRGLRSLFHASEALKKETFVKAGVAPRAIGKVGVLGAGLMGAGIALATVDRADLDVRLKDRDDAGLNHGLDYLHKFFDRRVARQAVSAFEAGRQLRRVTTTTDYSGFASCDLVIEAVFESVELKHQMLRDIEALGREDIIFGSNTSSIPITKIAEAAVRPENVIGLHYFSPVEKMPLLEIITTDWTAPEVTSACVAFGKAQGKTVIVVRDGPGFYTTRVLAPYLNEAARLLGEGVPVRDIDKALLAFGFPVGPVSLMDEVGIDVGLKVGPILEQAFGERMAIPAASQLMQQKNWLGRKTGRGFYVYQGAGKKGSRPVNDELYTLMGVQPTTKMDAREIAERCVYMFANEAVHCLGDGTLAEPMHGDIGAVFGLGFLPFTGGPFRFIDQLGVQAFVKRLEALRERHGERFAPAPLLQQMARARSRRGQRFHFA